MYDLLKVSEVRVMGQAWNTYLLEQCDMGGRTAKSNPAKQDESEEEILVCHNGRCCRCLLIRHFNPIQEHC